MYGVAEEIRCVATRGLESTERPEPGFCTQLTISEKPRR
jgi:hypothetical protein